MVIIFRVCLSNPEGHLIAYRGLSRKNTRTEKLPILSMSELARVEQAPSRAFAIFPTKQKAIEKNSKAKHQYILVSKDRRIA